LIDRLTDFFTKRKAAILLQKRFRGHFIRRILCRKTRKDALIKLCVNETDFYTMEPLAEIPDLLFYSFQHKNDHIFYGFNLESLIQLIQKTPEKAPVKNPYNRVEFSKTELENIQCIFKHICSYFPQLVKTFAFTQSLSQIDQIRAKLREIREQPIQQRILTLFMEIDSLGNYTHPMWFAELSSRGDFRRLYRVLYNVWFHHARLNYEIRSAICTIGDPFENIIGFMNCVNVDVLRDKCLRVFENLVYGGVDIDHRRLGAFHALTALTVVSLDARIAMPWLYESLF
jgi:hypothetical protein